MNIFKTIKTISNNRTTYRVGLLQDKACRILKTQTNRELLKYGITSVEFAYLGLLFDNPKGLQANMVAEELGVKAPFVTEISIKLKEKCLIDYGSKKDDNRVKIILITETGQKFVEETEKEMRVKMRPWIEGVSITELSNYLVVLEKIINNYKSNE